MRKNIAIIFCSFVMFLLCGCDENQKEKIENVKQNINMQITADYNKKLYVSNPEKLDENYSVVMRYFPDFEKYEAYDDLAKCNKSCDIDLSFLGFNNKMQVLAFQVGEVTSYTSGCSNLNYDIPKDYVYKKDLPVLRNRKIKGNCLVLVVKDSQKEQEDNYIVVLDYEKNKSYIIKTAIWNPMNDHIPMLYLRDLTGDGLMDIVISNSLNENDAHMQVFRFNGETFKCIYNVQEEEQAFSCYLEENYKAVVECEKINLLDIGYTKKQLDSNQNYQRESYPYSHVYRKGKIKHNVAKDIVKIGSPENIELTLLNTYDEIIRYYHYVSFAKYNSICKVCVYLRYNEKSDYMDIYKVSIK